MRARAIAGVRALAARGERGERLALRIVFRAAPRFARPRAVARTHGTVEWRIAHADGTASLFTMAFADGTCTTSRAVAADPDLTLRVPAADFLALALDGENPVALVFKGRLRLQGDLDLAMRMGRCFGRRR